MIGLGNSVDRKEARVRGWGRGSLRKKFFGLRGSVWSKNKGGGPPPGPSPIAATELLKQAAKHQKFSPFKP